MSSASQAQAKAEVERALEEAERLRLAGRYREGIAILSAALKLGVEPVKIYFRLGNIYFDAGELAQAEAAYKRAIALDPDHVSAHHNLAVVYRRQGRFGDYIKQRKLALKLAGRRPIALSPEQARAARRLAWRFFLFGLGLVALLVLVLFLISRP